MCQFSCLARCQHTLLFLEDMGGMLTRFCSIFWKTSRTFENNSRTKLEEAQMKRRWCSPTRPPSRTEPGSGFHSSVSPGLSGQEAAGWGPLFQENQEVRSGSIGPELQDGTIKDPDWGEFCWSGFGSDDAETRCCSFSTAGEGGVRVSS